MQLFCAAFFLVLAAVVSSAAEHCEYGRKPGVWEGMTYQILDKKCKLFRYVDDIRGSPKQNKVSGEIYFIGDSLNRNLVLDVGKELNTSVSDYTPMAFDRGKPEKIGRNAVWRLGSLTVANLFHFGANEKENHWLGIARAGIQGMHNSTYGRICLDGPQYLKRIGVTEDPYMIVISSNYWDAMHWSYKTAGPPRKKVKNNTPGVKAGEDEPETEEWQVDEERYVTGAPQAQIFTCLFPPERVSLSAFSHGCLALEQSRAILRLLQGLEDPTCSLPLSYSRPRLFCG